MKGALSRDIAPICTTGKDLPYPQRSLPSSYQEKCLPLFILPALPPALAFCVLFCTNQSLSPFPPLLILVVELLSL